MTTPMTPEPRRFGDLAAEMDRELPHRPATFGDGVRVLRYAEVPPDAPARREGALVSVRVPRPHHTQPHQGWIYGAWSE